MVAVVVGVGVAVGVAVGVVVAVVVGVVVAVVVVVAVAVGVGVVVVVAVGVGVVVVMTRKHCPACGTTDVADLEAELAALRGDPGHQPPHGWEWHEDGTGAHREILPGNQEGLQVRWDEEKRFWRWWHYSHEEVWTDDQGELRFASLRNRRGGTAKLFSDAVAYAEEGLE